jgi:hypothetical protein
VNRRDEPGCFARLIDLLGQSEFNILVDSRAKQPARSCKVSRRRSPVKVPSIAPVNDRLIQEAAPQARHFGVIQDWRTLADYFKRLEARSRPAINIGMLLTGLLIPKRSSSW